MANQPAPDTTSMLIRLPITWKERLYKVAEDLNERNPGARYSAHSIALDAITARVEEIEKENEK